MQVNKAQLSQILGISERTLTTWQDEGMPAITTGAGRRGNVYESSAVIRWMIEREIGSDLTAQRTRLTKAQAEKAELENNRLRGELLPAALVRAQIERVFGAVRARLLAFPQKYSPQVMGLELAAVRDKLDAGIRDALSELTTLDLRDTGDDPRGDQVNAHSVSAAAAADGERVGRQAQKTQSRGKRRARPVED